MKSYRFFKMGFKEMLPITTGVIPFGAIVGTLCSDAQFSFGQAFGMNIFVYAGASQLAAVELMTKHAASIVVILTGLVINLRFLLYSAALSPVVQRSSFLVKIVSAYMLTDQSYAVMSANQDKLPTDKDAIEFYFGASGCMMLVWHSSMVAGYIFGNFAPPSIALDFAVPLSFIALVIPTLKNKNYVLVAVFSSLASIALHTLPYKTGLIGTSIFAISLAAFLTRKRESP